MTCIIVHRQGRFVKICVNDSTRSICLWCICIIARALLIPLWRLFLGPNDDIICTSTVGSLFNNLDVGFFYHNVHSNVFKCTEAIRVSHLDFHIFRGDTQRADYNINLLFIGQWLTDPLKLTDHIGHTPQIQPHGVLMIHLVGVELDVERVQLSSRTDTKSRLQNIQYLFSHMILLKLTNVVIIYYIQQCRAFLNIPLIMERIQLNHYSRVGSLHSWCDQATSSQPGTCLL